MAAADSPLIPFADRREQSVAEDAMRATLPPGQLKASVPSLLAKAWDAGYMAGDRDAHNTAEARRGNGRYLDDDELATNPYRAVVEADGGATPATDRDTVREQIEDKLHRAIQEASWVRGVAMLDSDVAAFRDAALSAVLAEVVDPLLAAIARVEALADELTRVAQDSDRVTAVVYRQNADRIRRALDGDRG